MYRVVLIDDERMIVEGLRKVIPWPDYDCAVAGTAEDAASGAELIREMRPHIVFTDIRMPGQDGLAMLAGLRSEFPDLQVSVLTGYRDFSYAQEAILAVEELYGEHHWELDTILQEEGNLHLYEKMGYHRVGNIEHINDRMDIVFYEKK